MGYAEKRDGYWRGRYRIANGRLCTVKDASGAAIRFRGKREAERAANDAEAKARHRPARIMAGSRETFGNYVNTWYAEQDLAASTMQNYRRHIEEHLLPTFQDLVIVDIQRSDVAMWEKQERAAGYAESSIKTWRSTLHLILEDAVEEGFRDDNPAARRRGRGRRVGKSRARGIEKVVTTALGTLLIAERAALLSGRDDEFVALVLKGFAGIRWGELVGLETSFVRQSTIRIEWQLYELDNGELHRCPPKDDSRRTIDIPPWLSDLLRGHIARNKPEPCPCHEKAYVFRGYGSANGAAREPGQPKLVDVAKLAGVSTGTVSAVLNRPDSVRETTRIKVELAIAELGYDRTASFTQKAAHWRRNGFATWLFQPATKGWYPQKAPQQPRPVSVLAEPWPGIPLRGRGAAGRANACWLPLAPGLTPHGLRHTHKTLMEELVIPTKLMDERMGHLDGSVQARYSHVTTVMRQQLNDALTKVWEEALSQRRKMSPRSPVAVLDRLLDQSAGA